MVVGERWNMRGGREEVCSEKVNGLPKVWAGSV